MIFDSWVEFVKEYIIADSSVALYGDYVSLMQLLIATGFTMLTIALPIIIIWSIGRSIVRSF